jgi:hypothetical protein
MTIELSVFVLLPVPPNWRSQLPGERERSSCTNKVDSSRIVRFMVYTTKQLRLACGCINSNPFLLVHMSLYASQVYIEGLQEMLLYSSFHMSEAYQEYKYTYI